MDAGGSVVDWNPAAEELFGYPRDAVLGRELAELIIPGEMRDAHRHGLRRVVETGEQAILDRRVELTATGSDGQAIPVELSVTQMPDTAPPLFVGFVRDLRHRDAARRENARLQARMAFLAQAGLVLDRSLEVEETLRALAELTVPEVAQLTVIDVLDERMLTRAVAASADGEQAEAVEEMRSRHPMNLDSSHPVAEVLRTGRPLLVEEIDSNALERFAQAPEHLELMTRLRYRSAVVVPLIARRHILGALSLLRFDDVAPFDSEDLVLGEELARRAALAVDNARAYESAARLARTLQDSLLPRALPSIPHVRLLARYHAAAEGQDVGGDFYDAFSIAPGRWGVAIGDVCGKGPEAAALTALARHTIRAHGERRPAEVLARLNQAVRRDGNHLQGRFLTALFARLTLVGPALALDIAAAGHPAPLLMHAGGEVEPVPVTGPMIGIAGEVSFNSVQRSLAPGESLVLYTDGLTDARAPARILSDTDLARALERAQLQGPERIIDLLERTATGGQPPRDDIAVLVVHREAVPGESGTDQIRRRRSSSRSSRRSASV